MTIEDDIPVVLDALTKAQNELKDGATAKAVSKHTPYTVGYVRTVLNQLSKTKLASRQGDGESSDTRYYRGKY